MNEFDEEVPETIEDDIADFTELYILAVALILQILLKAVQLPIPNLSQSQLLIEERKIRNETRRVIRDLNEQAVSLMRTKVTKAYVEGVAAAKATSSEVEQNLEVVEETLSDTHQKKLETILNQTQEDLLAATQNTDKRIVNIVRKIMSQEMANVANTGRNGKQKYMAENVETKLKEQFIKNGFKDVNVAIVDAAKRKWKLETYSSMVVRTKMNMAYIDAIREEGLITGIDLGIINTNPSTTDECKNYEGMIISLNNNTEGYLSYEEIKASKKCFHPNCRHFVRPIRSIELVPENYRKTHESQMDNYQRLNN